VGPAGHRDDCAPLQRWEDEGGHHSADDPVELGWAEFRRRFFPGRRRHDLAALEAYAAYRSEGEASTIAAPSRGIHPPAAVSQKPRKDATS
jgi:hypothetical protein